MQVLVECPKGVSEVVHLTHSSVLLLNANLPVLMSSCHIAQCQPTGSNVLVSSARCQLIQSYQGHCCMGLWCQARPFQHRYHGPVKVSQYRTAPIDFPSYVYPIRIKNSEEAIPLRVSIADAYHFVISVWQWWWCVVRGVVGGVLQSICILPETAKGHDWGPVLSETFRGGHVALGPNSIRTWCLSIYRKYCCGDKTKIVLSPPWDFLYCWDIIFVLNRGQGDHC